MDIFGRKRKLGNDKDVSESDCANHPDFVTNLLEYFEFCSKDTKTVKDGSGSRKRSSYTLQCRICKDIRDKNRCAKTGPSGGLVSGNSQFAFTRHLLRVHKNELSKAALEKLEMKQSETYKLKLANSEDTTDSETESIVPAIVGITGSSLKSTKPKKYDEAGMRQQVFNKHVLDWIILDNKPLNSTSTTGFKQLIYSLDPRLTCQSRQTITRSLTSKYQKIVNHIRKTLNGLKPASAHLILDIWSSRQRLSVIGVQVRFMKDWKIHQFVLGFKHFPGSHDAESIRKKLSKLISDVYGLSFKNFLTITADNASAILSAFKDPVITCTTTTNESLLSVESPIQLTGLSQPPIASEPSVCSDGPQIVFATGLDTNKQCEETEEPESELLDVEIDNVEIEQDIITNENIQSAIDAVIMDWGKSSENSDNFNVSRNSCLAHLLQLAIRDALQNKDVADIIKRVNSIVSWFHKTNKFYTLFRTKSKLSLVKPCETRWNSTYHCLKRICREVPAPGGPDDKVPVETMASVVNQVLQEAKKTSKKVPQGLSLDDLSFIKVLTELLEPFASLTDVWQGDGVTSSMVIYGLIDAIRTLDDVKIEEVSEQAEEILKAFKDELKASVIQRFETDPKDQKTRRRTVTKNVFRDNLYILATLLDPRLKTVPFEDNFVRGIPFANGYPTKEFVIQLLRSTYREEEEKQTMSDTEVEIIGSHAGENQTSQEEHLCTPNSMESGGFSDRSQTASLPASPAGSASKQTRQQKKDIFARVQQHQASVSQGSKDKECFEVDEYFNTPTISGRENHLKFWRLNKDRFPVLSSIAQRVLSMPATSASVERLFSVAGAIISQRRTRMKINTAEMVLLYKDYLRCGLESLPEEG